MDFIQKWDSQLLLDFNSLAFSSWDYFFAWPTFLGEAFILLPLVFVLMRVWDQSQNIYRNFFLVCIAAFVSGCSGKILKELFHRDRPYSFFYDAIDKGEVIVYYLFHIDTSNSFPSGHTITVFAVAVTLNMLYKNRLLFLYPLALWIALTRVYVAAHFPSDILAGAFIGMPTAWMTIRGLSLKKYLRVKV